MIGGDLPPGFPTGPADDWCLTCVADENQPSSAVAAEYFVPDDQSKITIDHILFKIIEN